MKVKTIHLDRDEMPKRIVVEMTPDEALFMVKVTGNLSAVTARQQYGRVGAVSHEVYEALVGSVFNRFWENGAKEAEQRLGCQR